jgi:hypothetical protein
MVGGALMTGVGTCQEPLVQAVPAITEPVARSLVGPGDESVEDMDMYSTALPMVYPVLPVG